MPVLGRINCVVIFARKLKTPSAQVSRNVTTSATLHANIPRTNRKYLVKLKSTRKRSLYATPSGGASALPAAEIEEGAQREGPGAEEVRRNPSRRRVVAFATAGEYDFAKLLGALAEQNLCESRLIQNEKVIHAVAKHRFENEPREIFFFRKGSIVLWNITDLESSNILGFLRNFEQDSYSERLVQSESEIMNYKYHEVEDIPSCLEKDGDFVLTTGKENLTLDKYTFSNAMALSVKLGIWEASLDKYIDEIEFVTEDLKRGKKLKMTREDALRKHGELFALRHYLNLSSDVLDTPDFYWDNEQLEKLYNQVCTYFCINKRTKVMNEKINHCVALIELISSHLSDKHHIRLEWMIIVLIMVEVAFETIHYIDKYATRDKQIYNLR